MITIFSLSRSSRQHFVLKTPRQRQKISSDHRAPVTLLEADQHEAFAHKYRALYQHTVRGQKLKLLLVAHGRQLVFESQRLILQTACIEKLPQGKSALLLSGFQLRGSRVVVFNVSLGVFDAVVVQPLSRFLAGGAFGVADKLHGHVVLS